MTEAVALSPRGGDHPLPTWVAADACTLPTSEQPVRVAELDALFAETLARAEQRSPTSARFLLAGGREVARLAQTLADRESECCSFFRFAITAGDPGSIVMDVTVPSERAEVLAALVARAHQAREASIAEGTS